MNDTPKTQRPESTADEGPPKVVGMTKTSVIDPETIAKLEAIDDIVEDDLKTLKMVLSALAKQLMAHLKDAQEGDIAPSEISSTARQALPLVAMLMQQEKKVDEQIQQRVGKAGSFAFDLEGARAEIGRRLIGLRRAGTSGSVPE